tara:strand:+ start:139 stop:429 length:291 start_codon:yes stop_codon:yes gene_type:complete
MTTQDNNKLIAEFMGWDIQNQTTIPTNIHLSNLEFDNGEVMELKYHTEWNWLMPVIHKCFDVSDDGDMVDIMHHLQVADMKPTYKAVVEFINQYNK